MENFAKFEICSHLHLGGSDLELVVMNGPNSGEYTAEWNTTGIDPTKKGDRQDITMILTVKV